MWHCYVVAEYVKSQQKCCESATVGTDGTRVTRVRIVTRITRSCVCLQNVYLSLNRRFVWVEKRFSDCNCVRGLEVKHNCKPNINCIFLKCQTVLILCAKRFINNSYVWRNRRIIDRQITCYLQIRIFVHIIVCCVGSASTGAQGRRRTPTLELMKQYHWVQSINAFDAHINIGALDMIRELFVTLLFVNYNDCDRQETRSMLFTNLTNTRIITFYRIQSLLLWLIRIFKDCSRFE